MATYQFRCLRHGDFDVRLPLGTAPLDAPCPVCTDGSRRVWSAPRLGTTARRALALLDATERSAAEPEVVTALPARGGARQHVAHSSARGRGVDPRRSRLPRP